MYRTSKLIVKRSDRLKKCVKNLISLIERYDFNSQKVMTTDENDTIDDDDDNNNDDDDDNDDDETNGIIDDDDDDDNYSHFNFEIDDLRPKTKPINERYMELNSPSVSSVSYHNHLPHSPYSIYNEENLIFSLNRNCKLNCRHGAASISNDLDAVNINNENSIILCSKEDKCQQQNGFNCNNIILSSVNANNQMNFSRPQTLAINYATGENSSNKTISDQDTALVACSSSNNSSTSSVSNDNNQMNDNNQTLENTIDLSYSKYEELTSSTTAMNINDVLSNSSSVTCSFVQTDNTAPLACEEQSRVSTPSNLSRETQEIISNTVEIVESTPSKDEDSLNSSEKQMPVIRVINSESAVVDQKNNALIAYSQKNKLKPTNNLFLSPTTTSSNMHLSSSSSNNNLSVKTDSQFLGLPPSPSGYSSSGSCYSKTPLPSPRISKKYAQGNN